MHWPHATCMHHMLRFSTSWFYFISILFVYSLLLLVHSLTSISIVLQCIVTEGLTSDEQCQFEWLLTTRNLNVMVGKEDESVRKWLVRVCYRRKVSTVGHLGGEEPVTFPVTRCSEMPDGWNFPTAITHVPATFARFHLLSIPSPSNFLVVKHHFDIAHH